MSEPTVVFVHGAFADASGFAGVIRELSSAGHPVIAPPNPLRSLASDAAALSAVVRAIDGPVLLVGHSYGGAVITQASAGLDNVTSFLLHHSQTLTATAPTYGFRFLRMPTLWTATSSSPRYGSSRI